MCGSTFIVLTMQDSLSLDVPAMCVCVYVLYSRICLRAREKLLVYSHEDGGGNRVGLQRQPAHAEEKHDEHQYLDGLQWSALNIHFNFGVNTIMVGTNM